TFSLVYNVSMWNNDDELHFPVKAFLYDQDELLATSNYQYNQSHNVEALVYNFPKLEMVPYKVNLKVCKSGNFVNETLVSFYLTYMFQCPLHMYSDSQSPIHCSPCPENSTRIDLLDYSIHSCKC